MTNVSWLSGNGWHSPVFIANWKTVVPTDSFRKCVLVEKNIIKKKKKFFGRKDEKMNLNKPASKISKTTGRNKNKPEHYVDSTSLLLVQFSCMPSSNLYFYLVSKYISFFFPPKHTYGEKNSWFNNFSISNKVWLSGATLHKKLLENQQLDFPVPSGVHEIFHDTIFVENQSMIGFLFLQFVFLE